MMKGYNYLIEMRRDMFISPIRFTGSDDFENRENV